MKNKKRVSKLLTKVLLLISVMLFFSTDIATAQETYSTKWIRYINLHQYLEPFWKADTIYDETIQPIKAGTGLAEAKLLFKVKKLLRLRTAYLTKEFKKGRDWVYKNGEIILPPNSSAPYFDKNELLFNIEKPGWSIAGKTAGTYVLFQEGPYFASKQLKVTNVCENNENWNGPVPVFAETLLPKTIAKLQKRDKLKIVYYGDSITKGGNVSGFINIPPFMPTWADLVTYNLETHYHVPINSVNLAVGGTTSEWGVENVVSQVVPQKPDLTIIAFGMNDGTLKVSPEQFRRNIQAMIDSIRKDNADAEFILVSPMLANPVSSFSQNQELYDAVLDSLTGKGIAEANITGVHKELLNHKSYQDMTGNNINHTNDYLARWYAQFISGLLIRQ
ncbi:MAG: SGNH/GDSL hydrolase family protein [Coriobacteriia bacterium]